MHISMQDTLATFPFRFATFLGFTIHMVTTLGCRPVDCHFPSVQVSAGIGEAEQDQLAWCCKYPWVCLDLHPGSTLTFTLER